MNTPLRATMDFIDLIADADVLFALEAEELGLQMLPLLAEWRGLHPSQPLTLNAFVAYTCGTSTHYSTQYGHEQNARVELALREAWAWLEGSALLIKLPGHREPSYERALSRRALQLAKEPDARRALSSRRIPKDALHPSIREDVWAFYHRGKYDTAVFEAMKAVEVTVREAAGLSVSDLGTDLMRKAFDATNGGGKHVLTFSQELSVRTKTRILIGTWH